MSTNSYEITMKDGITIFLKRRELHHEQVLIPLMQTCYAFNQYSIASYIARRIAGKSTQLTVPLPFIDSWLLAPAHEIIAVVESRKPSMSRRNKTYVSREIHVGTCSTVADNLAAFIAYGRIQPGDAIAIYPRCCLCFTHDGRRTILATNAQIRCVDHNVIVIPGSL